MLVLKRVQVIVHPTQNQQKHFWFFMLVDRVNKLLPNSKSNSFCTITNLTKKWYNFTCIFYNTYMLCFLMFASRAHKTLCLFLKEFLFFVFSNSWSMTYMRLEFQDHVPSWLEFQNHVPSCIVALSYELVSTVGLTNSRPWVGFFSSDQLCVQLKRDLFFRECYQKLECRNFRDSYLPLLLSLSWMDNNLHWH